MRFVSGSVSSVNRRFQSKRADRLGRLIRTALLYQDGSLSLHAQDEHWVIIGQSQDRAQTHCLKLSDNSYQSFYTQDLI